jgi:predicted DNA-binding protein (MmcQ/YjbR family)
MAVSSGAKALAHLRRICLGLPETSETDSFGHPNFRAGKRTFAAFEWIKGRPSIAIRLDAAEADLLLSQQQDFFRTPYGRGIWVSAWADAAPDWALLEDLIERAYRNVALKRMLIAFQRVRGRILTP